VTKEFPVRAWQRGDILAEDVGDDVKVRHRALDVRLADTLLLARSSLAYAVFEFLSEPRTDEALRERFPVPELYAAVHALSAAGIVFRGEAAERAFLARRNLRGLIEGTEALAQDLLGLGGALFDDRRQEIGAGVSRDLGEVLRLISDVGDRTSSAHASWTAEQARKLASTGRHGELMLNLGSGRQRLPGWIGIDVQECDLRLNLRNGLPFPDASARYVYSAHFIEHLSYDEAARLLAEVHRVLAPGGVLRVVVPDIEVLVAAYLRADESFFARRAKLFPEDEAVPPTNLARLLAYAGVGRPATDLGGHRAGYDFATLSAILARAGFRNVERSGFDASRHEALRIDHTSTAAVHAIDGISLSLFAEATR
jgi:SAM-dependent methyltransferase